MNVYTKVEPLNNVRLQLKIPTHIVDTDAKLNIQLIKQVFLNVDYKHNYSGRTGAEVFTSFQNSYAAVVKKRADKVVETLGKWGN